MLLDTYIRNLSLEDWHNAIADVQFLGPGMSHKMGALLLSKVIHNSINVNNNSYQLAFGVATPIKFHSSKVSRQSLQILS